MAHRGRISILHNFLGKSLKSICNDFSEVDEQYGDVKYHLGTRAVVSINYETNMDDDDDDDDIRDCIGENYDIHDNHSIDCSSSHNNINRSNNNINCNSTSSSRMRTKILKVNLAANPSHLEAVNAVVLGRCELFLLFSFDRYEQSYN